MTKLNVKSNKVNRQINITEPKVLSLTGQALLDALGPETVDAYLIDKVKIATRAKVRNMLEKTGDNYMSDDSIKAEEDWESFVPQYQARTDKTITTKRMLDKLSPEELAEILAAYANK